MALFKRQDANGQLPPPPTEPLINEVFRLLDEIGTFRLRVNDPRIKVCLTQISQNGEHRLTGGSNDPPTDVAVIEFRSKLQSVVRVLTQYVDFQNNSSRYPNAVEEMKKGQEAITGFASYVMETNIPGGSRSLTDFKVDTDILAAQQHR